MRVLFWGTSEFGLPAVTRLLESGYEIVGVVTQPDRPAGRKQEPLPSPVKTWALAHGLKVFQPPHLSSPASGEELKEGDLFVVASYGLIIPKEILDLPKFGALNLHPSLLPKYRGPSPIQAAILNGDHETGVTIIQMDKEMDHGDIVANEKFNLPRQTKIGYQELHNQLAELAAKLLMEILPKYLSGEMKPRAQDHARATYTKLIQKKDARINWREPAEVIDRQVRAYEKWPVAWTMLSGKRLKIYAARVHGPENIPAPVPGTIVATKEELLVACGLAAPFTSLSLIKLQLEGGKQLDARSFANGVPGLSGQVLR